ncbi:MAG: GNAT family N-acetyltransferase [Alphaproteobacteria bacterium]|nr:GNAT family N-acetyltransferase [Alphaproteobacteria bacterium]
MHIQQITPDDGLYPAMKDLRRKLFFGGRFLPDNFDEQEKYNTLLVAVEDDRVVGSAVLTQSGDGVLARQIGVLPEYRRRGFGRRLIDACADAVRALGYRDMHVFAYPDSVEFYKKCGFKGVGDWNNLTTPQPTLMMRKYF